MVLSVPAGITIVLDGVTAGVGWDAAGDKYSNFQNIYLHQPLNDSVTGSASNANGSGSGRHRHDQQRRRRLTQRPTRAARQSHRLDGSAEYRWRRAAGDRLTNIEILEGSHNDDTLWGGTGNDTLRWRLSVRIFCAVTRGDTRSTKRHWFRHRRL